MADDGRNVPDVPQTEVIEDDAVFSTSTDRTIGEIPPPNQQEFVRRTSSLTVENVKKLEEATIREDKRESEQRSASPTKSFLDNVNLRNSSPLAPLRSSSRVAGDVEDSKQNGILSGARQASLPDLVSGGEMRTGSPKPLPPIRRNDDEAGNDNSVSEKTNDSNINRRQSQPRILSFRRELPIEMCDDSALSNRSDKTPDSVVSKRTERSVSFKDDHEMPNSKDSQRQREKLKSPAVREVTCTKDDQGKEHVLVSVATETEWSWFESMKLAGKDDLHKNDGGDQFNDDKCNIQSPSGVVQKPRSHKSSVVSSVSDTTDLETALVVQHNAKLKTTKDGYDEKGLPLLELDSESEDSDDDNLFGGVDDLSELVPKIGPPVILKYQRESEKNLIKMKHPVIYEERMLSPDSLALSEEIDGMFSGQCEFCTKDIQPFPTPEMLDAFPEKDLYCCNDYHKFVEFTMTHSPDAQFPVEELIDISPHAPFGSKQARRAAKERAAQRMREREMARQKAAGANQANFYALQVARQMKTINYSLSSQKYIDDGWTLRPSTPSDDELKTPDVYEPEPVIPSAFRNMKESQRKVTLIEKTYEDGNAFLIMFPDGTGTVFYPSGNPAILITSTEEGQFTYIIQEDRPINQAILAVFEPTGHGTCYHPNGNVKLNMNQFGGTFLDSQGARKKRWSWKDQTTHVHAPPFQPICFAISKYVSLRCLAQDQIVLLFSCDKRSVRFNVGVKLKLIAPENIPMKDVDEDALYISEVRTYVRLVMDKVGNMLKFSKSPKLENIQPPLRIQHNVIRNEKLKGQKVNRKVDKKQALVKVN
ncbi:glutamate-rich protein 6-like isoform X2 [Anneissia japonica]|uniref:glutamate-rich protein 6-like isoform X2 n=1 Tax=Anneissia japonica TaxID=1529436 RepID=UPI001425A001|nr:glutamate-rich protein 6-like isoform X2 [Anneissia japonica]